MVEETVFYSRQGQEMFIFSTTSRLAVETTQTPIHWVPEAFSTEVKRLGHEAHYSSGAIPPLPKMISLSGASLIKHRDNFTYTFYMSRQWTGPSEF
jgi:hypothetical protein